MKRTMLAALLLSATSAIAQGPTSIAHEPVTCLRGGEMPSLQMKVEGDGQLRAYFRRINTTDWCSVEGVNQGPLSRVTLPKFEGGDEIEYFFVLLDGRRVLARSGTIYRARVTGSCETAWVRYNMRLVMDCGENTAGSIPSSTAAGYSVRDILVEGRPPYGSPDRPNPQGLAPRPRTPRTGNN
jgi:hypothetical protein